MILRTFAIVIVCFVSMFCSGQSIELIDVLSVSSEGYSTPILKADVNGGTIDFIMEKGEKTCPYQFEWSFAEDIMNLENGDRINIDLNYNRQKHFCGQKRVYGLATGSNKVLQIPNYDYNFNSNIKYVDGTGNAHTWYDGYEAQSFVLEVDIDKPRKMTTFSIQTGPHRIFYVFEFNQNATSDTDREMSKAMILPKGQQVDTEK